MSSETPQGVEQVAIEIPWQRLSADTLQGMLEELVTRDGTDYGFEETSEAARVEQLKTALERGRAKITFDPDTETWTVLACD